MTEADLNAIAKRTLDAAFNMHKSLGPGLLESAYKACLAIELRSLGLQVDVESPCPLVYKGEKVSDVGYRMDLLIERELVVEIKAIESIHFVHKAQLLSYLRLSDKRLGLLLNFNVILLRDGITRIVNGF